MPQLYLKSAEYNIAEHCNLRCAGCDHASPLLPRTFLSPEQFERDLRLLKQTARVGTFKLLGGEPTLHPKITELLLLARSLDLAETLCVITNGTLLHQMPDRFWLAVDLLQVTIYPEVVVRMTPAQMQAKAECFGVKLEIEDKRYFRHTILDEQIGDAELVKDIYKACELPTTYACHTVRNGRFYKCSPAAFTADRLQLRGIAYDDTGDSVVLQDREDMGEILISYLNSDTPLPSCAFCLGTCGSFFEGYQIPRQSLKVRQSVAAHTPDTRMDDLLDRVHLEKRLQQVNQIPHPHKVF